MTDLRRPAPPTNDPESSYTGPVEDYLKVIYDLQRAGGGATATTSDIAHRLGIAPASVTGMIRRLAERRLLKYERYHGVQLTPEGRRVALRTIRRHRVLETFLSRRLGYPWDEVHDEAERLEHAASDVLIDRMAAALDEPTIDPHGAPIPTSAGAIAERSFASLADFAAGDRVRVLEVGDEDADRLRYLAQLGLVPGANVVITERAPFDGPITLRVARGRSATTCQIGPGLAHGVLVEPARPA